MKVRCWKEKFLSQTGRESLIKAVLQAIPIYSMSVFLLTNLLIDNITISLPSAVLVRTQKQSVTFSGQLG